MQLAAPDELENKFQQLEGNDVDDELAQMKKRALSGASPPKAEKSLPEGRPIRCAQPRHAAQAALRILRVLILDCGVLPWPDTAGALQGCHRL